jgi:hypothetical protein
MGTEAFPQVTDEQLTALIVKFVEEVATLTGTKRFHCVVGFWSEAGVTSCSTAGPNTQATLTIWQSVVADMVAQASERSVPIT